MKRLVLASIFLIPSYVFADRLGSLNPNSQVALSTKAIENSLTPATTTQVFSIASGQFDNTASTAAIYVTENGFSFGIPGRTLLDINYNSTPDYSNIYWTDTSSFFGFQKRGYWIGNVNIPDINASTVFAIGVSSGLGVAFGSLDNSKYVALRSSAVVANNIVFTLPASDGTNGQTMVTDGNANLSFATAGGVTSSSTSWIQNTLTPTTTTQRFSVQEGTVTFQLMTSSITGIPSTTGRNLTITAAPGSGNNSIDFVDDNGTKRLTVGRNDEILMNSNFRFITDNVFSVGRSDNSRPFGIFASKQIFVGMGSLWNTDQNMLVTNVSDLTVTAVARLSRYTGTAPQLQIGQPTSITYRPQMDVNAIWIDSTDATRKARVPFFIYDTSAREYMRADTDGTNPYETFFGSATFVSSVTINGPLIQSGTGGTSGQVLTSNGVNAVPTWQTTSAGGVSGFGPPVAVGTGTGSNFTTSVTSPTMAIDLEGADFTSTALGTTNYVKLNNTGVAAGSYTNPTITFDAKGRATSATSVAASTGTNAIFSSTMDFKDLNSTAISTITSSFGVGSLTLAANFFTQGQSVDFYAVGYSSSAGNSATTLRIRVSLGTATVMDSGAVTINAGLANLSNTFFRIDGNMACRTTGTSGTAIGQVTWRHNLGASSPGGVSGAVAEMFPATTATTTFDTTAQQIFNVSFQWNTAATTNGLVITNYVVSKN